MPLGAMTEPAPFWKTKSLAEMSREEWESLCDGCGRCCLNKLEDEDTGQFLYTRAACKLLDLGTCRCTDYPNRQAKVPDCVQLTPENVGSLGWLPATCAYRLLYEGQPIPDWHPLNTGDPDSTHKTGNSVRGITVPEFEVHEDDWDDYIIEEKP